MAENIIGAIMLGVLFGVIHHRNFYWRYRWKKITKDMR